MAEKLAPGDFFLRKTRESVSSLDSDKLAPVSPEGVGEESSDSDGEQEGSSHKLIRKVSTSGQMRSKVREKRLPQLSVLVRAVWGRNWQGGGLGHGAVRSSRLNRPDAPGGVNWCNCCGQCSCPSEHKLRTWPSVAPLVTQVAHA